MANLSSKTGTVTTPVQAQISLANNATTSIQDMSAYDSQEVTGFVYVDATADLRCSFKVQVVKNGANVFEIAAVDLAGDDYSGAPLLSFSMSGSVLRATLPNITGFTSAYLRYQLSAPYLGGNYPLTISAATTSITGGITLKAPTQTRYTSGSGTYTVPSGVLYLKVRMVGAGGGGGGGSTANGGGGGAGGGAGGYCESVITSPSASYSYAVGAGGSGGAGGAAGANGTAGGNTTFSTFTASGGGLGTGAENRASGNGGSPAGAGGAASGASINFGGGGGAAGYVGLTGSYGGSSGAGGNSAFGSGGASVFANTNGIAGATNSGAGGSGGGGGGTAGTGGAGAAGTIIIDEYYY